MHVVLAEYKHRTKPVLFPKELMVSQTQPYRCDTVWFWNLTDYFKTKRQQQQPSIELEAPQCSPASQAAHPKFIIRNSPVPDVLWGAQEETLYLWCPQHHAHGTSHARTLGSGTHFESGSAPLCHPPPPQVVLLFSTEIKSGFFSTSSCSMGMSLRWKPQANCTTHAKCKIKEL